MLLTFIASGFLTSRKKPSFEIFYQEFQINVPALARNLCDVYINLKKTNLKDHYGFVILIMIHSFASHTAWLFLGIYLFLLRILVVYLNNELVTIATLEAIKIGKRLTNFDLFFHLVNCLEFTFNDLIRYSLECNYYIFFEVINLTSVKYKIQHKN